MPLDVDHVVARHHHLADDGVAELEDGVDHPAARRTRSPRDASARSTSSRSSVSRRERALAEAPARGDRVAEQDQQPRAAGRGPAVTQRQRRGRPAARRARRAGGRGCAGATPMTTNETTSITPIVVSALGQHAPSKASRDRAGDDHDRGDLAQQPQQQRGVEVAARASSSSATSRRGAGRALGQQLLGAGAGERRERGVGGREERRPAATRARGRDQQPDVAHASAGRSADARQAASSSSWSPNISSCSSGSAWS